MLQESSGFLADGYATMGVHMSMMNAVRQVVCCSLQLCCHCYTQQPLVQMQQQDQERISANAPPQQPFVSMYDCATFSDIILKAGSTRIHAHKVILAPQSASFQAMFQVSPCVKLLLLY